MRTTTTNTADRDGDDEPSNEPIIVINPTFSLGHVCSTPGVRELLTGGDVTRLLNRHSRRDWGECYPVDRKSNEHALARGGRVFSTYRMPRDAKVWVITEADRSSTTVLLPNEY